jgi:hypothetical protein
MASYQLKSSDRFTGDKNRESACGVGHLPVAYELELHRTIQINAYYRAEKDGFKRTPLDYWLAAEDEVLSLV